MKIDYLISQVLIGRTLIFDLDNTIYEETDFLFGAYKKIAFNSTSSFKSEIFPFMRKTFIREGRKDMFQKVMNKFPDLGLSVNDCLCIIHSYKPSMKIQPYPWFNSFSARVGPTYVFNIVTNGNVIQQKNKIESIEFSFYPNQLNIVYANQFSPKPKPESFMQLTGFSHFSLPIFIGDTFVDRQYADNLGLEFVNVDLIKSCN